MSIEVGLGTKYKNVSFNNKKLELKKDDGSIDMIDKNNLRGSSIEKLRMYKTMEFIFYKTITKNNLSNLIETPDIIQKKKEITEKIDSFKSSMKKWYKDDVKVAIYYEDFFENLEDQSYENLVNFIKDAKSFVL